MHYSTTYTDPAHVTLFTTSISIKSRKIEHPFFLPMFLFSVYVCLCNMELFVGKIHIFVFDAHEFCLRKTNQKFEEGTNFAVILHLFLLQVADDWGPERRL